GRHDTRSLPESVVAYVRWRCTTMQLMSESWSPASISAFAAVGGSLVGAFGSSVSAWIAQRHQNRRDLLAKKIFHREQLYSDFISETAQAMAHARQNAFQDPSKLIPSYA